MWQLEKFPKYEIFRISSSTSFMLKTFSNSNWILKFEFEIKRGHFLAFGNLEITLNFILKLQKLQTPKLYN
jgi:hypothetical protein